MTEIQVRVREATPADCGVACQFMMELHDIHADALPHVFRRPGVTEGFGERMLELIAGPNSTMLIAEVDGCAAGVVMVVVRDVADRMLMEPRRYGWVESIAVGSRFHRRGVGRSLMEAAERWCVEHGAATCELNVWEFNSGAIEFYEELGYRPASRRMWKPTS